MVLDLMLPGLHGLEVFRQVRAQLPLPVVMLTALGDETDRLTGLELGADDYVTKPFSPRELVLRVQSCCDATRRPWRRPRRRSWSTASCGRRPAHEVLLRGVPLALTVREYDLLLHFLRNPRQAFSRSSCSRTSGVGSTPTSRP
jgi:DNA-binding response OmpR family regulator